MVSNQKKKNLTQTDYLQDKYKLFFLPRIAYGLVREGR